MKEFWDTLDRPWHTCLEEAWGGYCGGSLPIGAVVADEQGVILSRGRNRWHQTLPTNNQISGSSLAHAELNALIQLPLDRSDYHTWSLYTTLEPCPLCIGALYMVGMRKLHYAARDPWAGSINLLGATAYMSRKPIQVYEPDQPDLEVILIAMETVAILQDRITKAKEVLEVKRDYHPAGVRFGETLFTEGTLTQLKAKNIKASLAFNQLADLWSKRGRP